jgi:RNA polymerase sigma-70 factor (ECF subfamily)
MSLQVFQQRILPMKDKLYRLALRLLQNVQEAEDAVQETMIRIWGRRDEWDKWKSLEAYCMISMKNGCLDRLRKQKVQPLREEKAWDLASADKDPQEKMMAKEATIQIRKCMDELPQHQQLVIQLREIEGFSYNEIADVLDMSLDQVKVNLFRARNAIKRSIIKSTAE